MLLLLSHFSILSPGSFSPVLDRFLSKLRWHRTLVLAWSLKFFLPPHFIPLFSCKILILAHFESLFFEGNDCYTQGSGVAEVKKNQKSGYLFYDIVNQASWF